MSAVMGRERLGGAGLAALWRGLARDWHANARLRWGIRLILAIVWLWLMLVVQDQARAWRAESEDAQAELHRLMPLKTQTHWTKRADEAHAHLESARAMLWTAVSQGQAEATLQDSLREMSAKAGLNVRELTVAAADTKVTDDGIRPLRVRLVVDFTNRLAFASLLAELGRSPKILVVEALRLRPSAVPARAEMDIRVLYRQQAKVSG